MANRVAEGVITVVMSADNNYFAGLLVTMSSMAEYASQESLIEWVVLDGGILDDDFSFLEESVSKRHAKNIFRRVLFDKKRSGSAKTYHGSVMTYARLYLSDLLQDRAFALYCDVDFLWRADVSELWGLRDEMCSVQSVRDEWLHVNRDVNEEQWFAARGLRFPKNSYFCAGLCLFNLQRIREMGYDRMFEDFLKKHPDARLADQTVMNAVLPESEVGLLPDKWQRFISMVEPWHLCEPFALHYAGGAPWCKKCNIALLTDASMLWFREYAQLMGISVWSAICHVHNPLFAVISRLIFKFATSCRPAFYVFKFGMHIIGKDGYVTYCRKLGKSS